MMKGFMIGFLGFTGAVVLLSHIEYQARRIANLETRLQKLEQENEILLKQAQACGLEKVYVLPYNLEPRNNIKKHMKKLPFTIYKSKAIRRLI